MVLGALSARLLSAEAAAWFVSARFALLAVAASGAPGAATFTDVVLEALPVREPPLEPPF